MKVYDNEEDTPLLKTVDFGKDDQFHSESRIFAFQIPFSPKLIYFTLNMALYSSLTFTSAYFFERWGLPIYQFGALSALSIIELIGAMWWGGLADRSQRHKAILQGCTWMYCTCFCLLPVAEWLIPEEDAFILKMSISTVLLGGTYFFMSSFFPLVDSCVLRQLKSNRDQSSQLSFGKQRLWGTVGHAVISIISAQFISWFGWPGMFLVMILTCIFFSLIIYTIPQSPLIEPSLEIQNYEESSVSTTDGNDLLRFDFLLFLFVVLLSGYMRSILSIFLPYHLLIDLHQTPLFVGLTAVFRISAEIFIFSQSFSSTSNDSLSTRSGEVKMVLFGLAAAIVRVAGYSALTGLEDLTGMPLWTLVFVLESLKGVSVACLISGAVRLAHDLVPESSSTRAQALVSGTYSGLSTGLAGLIGGTVIYSLPDQSIAQMFKLTAMFGVLGMAASMRLLKIIK